MIDFKSIFDITKLPTKIFVVLIIASGLFLFFPLSYIKILHFEKFEKFAGYIGLLFVFSLSLVIVNFVIWIYEKLLYVVIENKIKKEFQDALSQLDAKEKAVLREFALQGQNSIRAPYDDAVVTGLIDKKILKFNKQLGNSFLVNGTNVSLSLTYYVSKIITPEMLELRNSLTEEEKNHIEQLRPEWIKNLN